MSSEEVIDTFEKLMNEISYDWPGSDWPKDVPKITKYDAGTDEIDGYGMQKTTIFREDGECWLTYKEDKSKVSGYVYHKFEQFYDLLYGDLDG